MEKASGIPINIKNFCYATIDETGEKTVYGAPVKIPGLTEIKLEMATETSKLSGDGKTRVIVTTEGDITIEATLNKIPLKDQGVLLGRQFDPAKGTLLKKDGDRAPYVASGFEIENEDGTSAYTWLYKGKFAQPSESFKQIEEGKVSFSNPTFKGTFIADADNEKAIVMDESEGTEPPIGFLASVYKVTKTT